MALINRMSRLLSADIHAVLDRIEEPEALLKQAIRDMEEQLARGRDHLLRLEREHKTLSRRRQKLDARLGELDTQLGTALDAGNEALARKVVRHKLQTTRFGEQLAERLQTLDEELTGRRTILAEQHERLDVMRQRADVLGESPTTSDGGDDLGRAEVGVSDDEVEVELMRERQRRKPS
jgi:phage shock protein A